MSATPGCFDIAQQDPPVRSKIQWTKILRERLEVEQLTLSDIAPDMADECQFCKLLDELGFHSALDRMAIRKAVKQEFMSAIGRVQLRPTQEEEDNESDTTMPPNGDSADDVSETTAWAPGAAKTESPGASASSRAASEEEAPVAAKAVIRREPRGAERRGRSPGGAGPLPPFLLCRGARSSRATLGAKPCPAKVSASATLSSRATLPANSGRGPPVMLCLGRASRRLASAQKSGSASPRAPQEALQAVL